MPLDVCWASLGHWRSVAAVPCDFSSDLWTLICLSSVLVCPPKCLFWGTSCNFAMFKNLEFVFSAFHFRSEILRRPRVTEISRFDVIGPGPAAQSLLPTEPSNKHLILLLRGRHVVENAAHMYTFPCQQQQRQQDKRQIMICAGAEWSPSLSVSLSNSCTYSFSLSVFDRF